MSTIVTDTGFAPDDWTQGFLAADQWAANDDTGARAVDLQPDADLSALDGHLDQIDLIRIAFPSFADGRGFSLAKTLRRSGFTGRLRAKGHVLADQYAMARRSGFDEVEIDADMAARQPEDQWQARADWHANDYQARLRG
ncbi:MAG: DUF934 domain-containing protein [Pseudomonadota bacterium]